MRKFRCRKIIIIIANKYCVLTKIQASFILRCLSIILTITLYGRYYYYLHFTDKEIKHREVI